MLVAGHDDLSFAAYCHPPLSTVRQPKVEIGCEAVKTIALLANRSRLESKCFIRKKLNSMLIVRASSALPVEWHMRQALAPLLFADEELNNERKTRDPVLTAQPSSSAKTKRATHTTPDGMAVHSFKTLLEEMAKRTRNTCRVKSMDAKSEKDPATTFVQITPPTPFQARVLELLTKSISRYLTNYLFKGTP